MPHRLDEFGGCATSRLLGCSSHPARPSNKVLGREADTPDARVGMTRLPVQTFTPCGNAPFENRLLVFKLACVSKDSFPASRVDANLDPNRIGARGSSAGVCTSLWLVVHDDLADPDSSDPIAQQSSRLSCAAVVGAQTSLDPKQLREWISNSVYGVHAFGFAAEGRSREQEFVLLLETREKVLPWIRDTPRSSCCPRMILSFF
jgi:hypothetical protein